MRKYFEKHHTVLGLLGGLVALAVAITYFYVVPPEASGVTGVQKSVLLHGHSVCWLLLAAASFMWALNTKNRWSVMLAYGALAVYVIFIVTLFGTKLI